MGVGGGGEITCWRNGEEREVMASFPLPNWRGESQELVGDGEGKINPNQQISKQFQCFCKENAFQVPSLEKCR